MISAEAAAHATGQSPQTDRLPRRKEEHVNGVDIAQSVDDWSRQVASSNLGHKLRLDLVVGDRAAVVDGRGINGEQAIKDAMAKGLVRPRLSVCRCYACGAVLVEHVKQRAGGNGRGKAGHAGRRGGADAG